MFSTKVFFFKPPFGKPITIKVDQSSTFKDVKDEIFKLRGIQLNQQQITFNQKRLSDESKVFDNMSGYNTAELIIPREITKKNICEISKFRSDSIFR